MYFVSWIYVNALLIFLATGAFLSAIVVPRSCFEDTENIWTCNISSNQDQISCRDLISRFTFQKRTVQLNIKTIDSDRYLVLFEGSDKCNINILQIEADQIPSNKVIRNLNTLEVLIMHSSSAAVPVSSDVTENLIQGLVKLRKIKIENFKVNQWNRNIFRSCTTITDINLKSLEIESIDFQSFVNCKELLTLSIRLNRIPRLIIASFNGLKELTKLVLSDNEITEIITNGNSWDGVDNLKELDFSNNKITKLLPRLFVGLKVLENLSFKSNRLITISKDAFVGLNELTVLDLQNNPHFKELDLNMLSPLKRTLNRFLVDPGQIQCVHDKQFLPEYRNGVNQELQLIIFCNPQPLTNRPIKNTVASNTAFVSESTNNYQLILIVCVTVLGTALIFITTTFIYCCVTLKSRNRKLRKLISQSDSQSRHDNISFLRNPTCRNYQCSEGTYAQFTSGSRNENQPSETCSMIHTERESFRNVPS